MQLTNPGATRLFSEGVVVKTANEIVNNSIVLQNDDQLFFAMLANSTYQVDIFIRTTSVTAVPDGRLAVTGPAGVIGSVSCIGDPAGAGIGVVTTILVGGGFVTHSIDPASNYMHMHARALVTTTNAGNFQVQWCQNVATVENTEVVAGSFLHWRQIV